MSATAELAAAAVSRAVSPAPIIIKEARALAPTFGAVLVAIVVGGVGESYFLVASGLLGFALGSVTLGAQSFGLEYSHRTLGLLLSQPVERGRLYLYKLVVLATMLSTLAATALVLFSDALQRAASSQTEPSMLLLASACGLFLAPWLAMLCRSTLAAVVFSIAIPGLLATGADIVGGVIHGLHNSAAIDRFRLVVFWRGMFLICLLSAIAGWRMFLRLEVIEGRDADVQFPDALLLGSHPSAPKTATRPHPVLALIMKELRLQQITFVVAALYVLAWLALAWMEYRSTGPPARTLLPLTALYVGVLAMLIGALVSAEERHLGTLEWQMLLPMPGWQQWAVKIGAAFALALLLGAALPAVLGFFTPGDQELDRGAQWQVGATIVLLMVCSVYVSSLCKSGVGALVLSFPSVVAAFLFVRTVIEWPWRLGWFTARARPWLDPYTTGLLLIAAVSGLIGLLLWLAFCNHRSADRSARRTSRQVLGIAAYIIAGLTVLVGLGLR